MTQRKTTWISSEGTVTFILPNLAQHHAQAREVDRPATLCELMDTIASLSTEERRALLLMASSYELAGGKEK